MADQPDEIQRQNKTVIIIVCVIAAIALAAMLAYLLGNSRHGDDPTGPVNITVPTITVTMDG